MLMYLQKLRKSKKGYTLTELIVVVAILAVLAAVATPLVTGQINKARDAADDANARTMENIIKLKLTELETTSITGVDAYNYVSAALGEMPEPTRSGYKFWVKTDGTKVQCSVNNPGGDSESDKWQEIKPTP